MSDRYHISGDEGTYEPGSNGQVLKNRVGITSPVHMKQLETHLLESLYQHLFEHGFPKRKITLEDIKAWHQNWLGNVYTWAGEVRTVNMTRDSFMFCGAKFIFSELERFQRDFLSVYTPTIAGSSADIIQALAITHAELVLIHPFRDGNGRLARVLTDVMAAQNGLPLIDYAPLSDSLHAAYIHGIQRSHYKDYAPIVDVFQQLISP